MHVKRVKVVFFIVIKPYTVVRIELTQLSDNYTTRSASLKFWYKTKYDWLNDFKDMSTCLGLFYVLRIRESHSLYVHIYIFMSFLKTFFCTWFYRIRIILNRFVLPIIRTLTVDLAAIALKEWLHTPDIQNWSLAIRSC